VKMTIMKRIHKIIALAMIGTGAYLTACEDVELAEPNIASTSGSSSANFLMVNASPDAPSLDLWLNNVKTGTSVSSSARAQTAYSKIEITLNGVGAGGATIPNTNIRAKATSDVIGGVLGSKDLIFKALNNSSNNFQAADSAFYTFIVVDTLTRPKPLRTNNALGVGDTTYFNPLTGQYIAGITRAPLPAAQKSRTVAIGTVPLGATDDGGIRFLVLTDQLPLPSTTRFPKPVAGKCSVRFIHASPNTGSVTVNVGASPLSGTTAAGIFSYPMNFPTHSPSVGQRSTTANTYATIDIGTLNVVVNSGAEIARQDNFTFEDRGVYTIILSGNRRTLPMSLTIIKNK
jgi:hypothetical protein